MLFRRITLFLFILSSIIIVPSSIINAQGTIKGKIIDQKGEALTGVNVFLTGTNFGAATNTDGMYIIKHIPQGTYTLKISMVGYKSSKFKIVLKNNETIIKNVALEEDILNFESVIVTGTAGGSGIKKKNASFAITTISAATLDLLSPPSTAAALDLVPGVWSESSGGVAGANIFVRGLPSSGDAPFVTMSINGAPIYGTETLSFLEQSSIFRIDETIASTEALRGGPSTVFSNGEAGLTTNFNLKKGTYETKGKVKYTTTDYSQERVDAVLSGPISEKFYYMVGGYVRTSPGIRNTEFNSEKGGQFTVQLTKVFDKGVVNGFARLTNDHGQWILPMALGTGNNLGTFSPLGNATRFRTLRINTQGDSAHFDFSKGRGWKGIVSGLNFDYEVGRGWTARDNLSYTSGQANTLGFVPNGKPMKISALLSKLGTSSIKTVGGKTLTSGYVQSYGYWVVEKKIESITNDISLTNIVDNHKITVGAYQSYWTSRDFWTLGNHVLVHNVANGDIIKGVSPNNVAGSWNYGLNEAGDARMFALYAGDSWQVTNKIRLDYGLRYNFFNLNFTLDAGAFPDGVIDKIANLDGKDWAGTGAINYAVNNNFGVFARASKGSLFPNFDDVRSNVYNLKSGNPSKGTVVPNLFNQYETGVKIEQKFYSLFVTGFLNAVEVFDGDVASTRASALLKTQTMGVEIDGGLSFDAFKVNFIGTFLNGKITSAPKAPETVGNKIWRQPSVQLRLAPSYNFQLNKNITALIYGSIRYVGARWNDRSNLYQLAPFTKIDLGVEVSTSSGLTFNLSSDNLNNSHGLTEGDPRNPITKNGRPILGRSIRFSIGINF